ncbi:Hypothetical predicted protein, partial [Paramuricea clavata]
KPDDQFLTRCPPKQSCLDSVNTPYSTITTTHLPMSVAEQSSEIEIGGLSGESRQDNVLKKTCCKTELLEKYFRSGLRLCPEELLVYLLMKIQFKTSTFTRHHSISQYKRITEAISKISGVEFEATANRCFFPRISCNELKSTVTKENGKISDQLKRICSMEKESLEKISAETFVDQFNNIIRPRLSDSSKWIPWFNTENGDICLFSFGASPGYAEKEVRLSTTFKWKLYLKATERDVSNCDVLSSLPRNIGTVELLVQLLSTIDNCKICDRCWETEKYHSLIGDSCDELYKTKDGKKCCSNRKR